MKLKEGFVTHEIDGDQIMVAVGSADFHGLVRSNETAAFIVDCLKTETDEDGIVNAMLAEYDAPEEVIRADVKAVIEKLRGIGAIDEDGKL